MLLVVLYLLSTILAPAPLVSMVVNPQPYDDHLDVVVTFLSSDPRYTEYEIDVDGITTPVNAPLHTLQTITTTLPLDLPHVCNAQAVYEFVVSARVLTDTQLAARTTVGGLINRPCPFRLYVP